MYAHALARLHRKSSPRSGRRLRTETRGTCTNTGVGRESRNFPRPLRFTVFPTAKNSSANTPFQSTGRPANNLLTMLLKRFVDVITLPPHGSNAVRVFCVGWAIMSSAHSSQINPPEHRSAHAFEQEQKNNGDCLAAFTGREKFCPLSPPTPEHTLQLLHQKQQCFCL